MLRRMIARTHKLSDPAEPLPRWSGSGPARFEKLS